MRIEVKERNVSYYDEIMYISLFMKKIIANPFNKVKGLSKYYKMQVVFWGCVTLLYLILTFITKFEGGFIYMVWFCLIFFIISLRGLIHVKKSLKNYSLIDNVSVFEMNNEIISITGVDETLISIKWDSVRNILISKNSIVFIPKENVGVLLTVSMEYVKDVLDAINKYKKNELVIDNRNLYK